LLVPNRSRDVTRINLKLCMPELAESERAQLERDSLMEAGRTMFELGALWNWERERVLALVREVRGVEALDEALREKRGVIGLTPHLGAWEMVGLWVGAHYPFTALYRPPRAAEMESVYRVARERLGSRLVPTDANGVRTIYRVLAAGEVCGILPDQDPGRGAGIFVPFFGPVANTTVFVARLAHKSGAPVIFSWAERLPRGAGFCLHFERGPRDLGDPDVEVATRALNREIERLVRRLPAQYLWSYSRFRTRPPGERSPYKLDASADE
jgi:KDO2-lipid IV(A) lauroyltransferase